MLLRSNAPARSRVLTLTSGRNDSSGRTVIRGSKALALSLWGSFREHAGLAMRSKKASKRRSFQSKPISVLDAPSIVNNYYMNLLSWNPQSDVLAVALGKSVFLWNRKSRIVTRLMSTMQTGDFSGDLYGASAPSISSVSWGSGSLLSVATEKGEVLLYDAIREVKYRPTVVITANQVLTFLLGTIRCCPPVDGAATSLIETFVCLLLGVL